MGARVVCISCATGAGGEEVGRLVAGELGFVYVDDEIVAQAAAQGGIDPAEVADEERRKSLVSRLLEGLTVGGETWALAPGGAVWVDEVSGDDIRALIREAVVQTVGRGSVVIVAHGASHAVSPSEGALRVLVTASAETRAERIADAESLDRGRAERRVKDADAARRDYLRRFYEVDEELPTHYDLVVNTDLLSRERAARLVAQAASG
jgi:cytidylate kinase